MGTKRDYYEILGIDQSADSDTIKKAYRKLVKKYHPDSNAGDAKAEERFKEVTEAYNILSDPEKRKLYDRFGHAAFQDTQTGYRENAGSWNNSDSGGGYREYHFEGDDMDDILKNIFGFQGSHFGEDHFYSDGFGGSGFGGSGFGRRGFRQDGADLQVDIDVSFDEAAFGCEKVVRLNHGDEAGGAVSSLKVKIPAGIDSGQSIRLRGKGMPGSGGGKPGDLLLKVKVADKAGYERRGMDIYTTAFIPFTTAVFGGEAIVQTLYGNVVCKIAEGTQSGTKIRLRGKGIVSMKNPNLRGDQYVTVQIQVPRDLNETARRKLREYERACGKKDSAA